MASDGERVWKAAKAGYTAAKWALPLLATPAAPVAVFFPLLAVLASAESTKD